MSASRNWFVRLLHRQVSGPAMCPTRRAPPEAGPRQTTSATNNRVNSLQSHLNLGALQFHARSQKKKLICHQSLAALSHLKGFQRCSWANLTLHFLLHLYGDCACWHRGVKQRWSKWSKCHCSYGVHLGSQPISQAVALTGRFCWI